MNLSMGLMHRAMVRKFLGLFLPLLWPHFSMGFGTSFVDVENFAKQYHLEMVQHADTDEIHLKNDKHVLCFSAKTKEAFVDNTKIFLTYPIGVSVPVNRKHKVAPELLRKHYTIPQVDVEKVLLPILFPSKILLKPIKTIVIDPGHGGKAEGTQNKRLEIKEKDLTLKTAKLLKFTLKKAKNY